MPLYEYFCDRCHKEVAVAQTMSEHEKGAPCPHCGGRDMRPLVGTFYSKTSKKS
jgi:putative FmdB family regulatory protein